MSKICRTNLSTVRWIRTAEPWKVFLQQWNPESRRLTPTQTLAISCQSVAQFPEVDELNIKIYKEKLPAKCDDGFLYTVNYVPFTYTFKVPI